MYPNLDRHEVVSIDVETTGVEWYRDKVFGVAVSTFDGGEIRDYYFDSRVDEGLFAWLRDQAPKINKVVNHNVKFDIHMLLNEGIVIDPRRVECTMINAALINEHLFKYDLDSLAQKYIGKRKDSTMYEKLAGLFGGQPTRTAQMKNISRAPKSVVEEYAKTDSRVAMELWMWQQKEIKRQGLQQVHTLEMRLFPFIFDMERRGIRVDVDLAHKTMDKLTVEIDQIQKELDKVAGFHVNPNPSGSIKKLFNPKKNEDGIWIACDSTPLPATSGDQPSIGADQLLAMTHPAAKLILRCRKYMKTRDTFLAKHVIEHAHNGRVHPNINQTKSESSGGVEGTGTGRLSYSNPALQQIPSRDKAIAAMVRPIFLPDEGSVWGYGDLDQHEFRIFAHYVNAPSLNRAYQENPDLDIHQIVADMTGMPRNATRSGQANAKQINLAMVFNMGGGKLAEKMGLPFTTEKIKFKDDTEEREILKPGEETLAVMAKYYDAVPGVKEMAKNASTVAKSRGYVRTLKGRHIRFPGGKFTHKASGLIYQGSSADLNKENICRICEYLEAESGGRLLLSIHDEYSISLSCDNAKKHLERIKYLIEDRPELRVPLRIDFSMPSKNWWEATQAEKITGKGWSHSKDYLTSMGVICYKEGS